MEGRISSRAKKQKEKPDKKPSKNLDKMLIIVIALAVAVILGGVVMFATGGKITGRLPDVTFSGGETSNLTGQLYSEELAARPIIVSIDNVGDALPQSWLSKADIVYEFPVEGLQTRLNAIFYGQIPEYFGPVRSTRPYFVDLTREYKGIWIAHGWSPQAKEYLLSDVVPYINAMNSDCEFYRVNDKEAPHNSYIRWSEIKAEIDEQGWWDEKQKIKPFGFLSGAQQNQGDAASYIEFDYDYSEFEFKYDADTSKYTRTIDNGDEYIDKETEEDITCYNILVQKVSSSVLDSKGRLSIDMCTGGEAVLFTNGCAVKGTWSREDLDSRTIFVDGAGNKLKLTRGNTWVEVVDQNCTITYK
ncbi:MAG: DUF3048 domain-containing protein [Clostridiales bacterium]|nr:DUF3048 domain-containing protein [Clostridiales bacterium]